MSVRSGPPSHIFQTLRRRCTELGLTLFQCDATVNIGEIAGETAPDHGDPLASPAALTELAGRLIEGKDDGPRELAPGRWAIPLLELDGDRPTGVLIAITPDTNAIGEESVDPGGPVPSHIAQLARVLRWSYDDVTRSVKDADTLMQFSDKLANAYESETMFFRLARLLNSSSDPTALLQKVCDQLLGILPYRWIAVQFDQTRTKVDSLRGQMFRSGELPFSNSILAAESIAVVEQTSAAVRVLEPRSASLAKATGCEVLVAPVLHHGVVVGVILASNKVGEDSGVSSEESGLVAAAADFLGIYHESCSRLAEQKLLFTGTLRALTASIDAKDPYTCGHSERVALLAAQLARAIGLETTLVETYHTAGLLHDVGKIGVPEAVLCKNGCLTAKEFAEIKRHPEVGHGILSDISMMDEMLPGVLHHHERFDGKGYPHGLAGEKIPHIARVLALADTFDAMSSSRSYRASMTREQVLAEIQRCRGSQFDPALTPAFIALDFSEFDRMLAQSQRSSPLAA